jgi:hypothetical protein
VKGEKYLFFLDKKDLKLYDLYIFSEKEEPVAQLVEQQPFKLWVVGSSPTRLTSLRLSGLSSSANFVWRSHYDLLIKRDIQIMRPYRLAWSRTSPFHGENRGSNPLRDASHLLKK